MLYMFNEIIKYNITLFAAHLLLMCLYYYYYYLDSSSDNLEKIVPYISLLRFNNFARLSRFSFEATFEVFLTSLKFRKLNCHYLFDITTNRVNGFMAVIVKAKSGDS